jgi:hypothetical protein
VLVDPVKLTLKAPGSKRLKLIYDGPLSYSAFKFKLRRYIMAIYELQQAGYTNLYHLEGRGLHSSTFRLNVSAFCGIWGAFRGRSGGV